MLAWRIVGHGFDGFRFRSTHLRAWLAKIPELAEKKAVLSVLQQRLAGLEQDKANWRKLRDAYKTGQSEHEKPIVCYDPAQDNSGLTRWCDDYKIYQYAFAIAMQDPENAGITLLNHASYRCLST